MFFFLLITMLPSTTTSYGSGDLPSMRLSVWDAYYNHYAENDVLWNRGMADESLVNEILNDRWAHRTDLTFLEIGCGLGHDSLYTLLQPIIMNVICLEPSSSALHSAMVRVRVALSNISTIITTRDDRGTTFVIDGVKRVTFVHAALGVNFSTILGSEPLIDLVWIRSVLQHLCDADAHFILSYVKTLLRPGGRLVVKEFIFCPGVKPEPFVACGQMVGPQHTRPSATFAQLLRDHYRSCEITQSSMQSLCTLKTNSSTVCADVISCTDNAPKPVRG